MKKYTLKKIWSVIKQKRAIRTQILLDIIFIVFIFVFISLASGYKEKAGISMREKVKNEQLVQNLEQIVNASELDKEVEAEILIDKSFADHEEVIPFISFLENIFFEIDQNALITIKSKEDQIFMDHFADYTISLNINGKADLFLGALDEIYNSRFIIETLDFKMDFKNISIGGKAMSELNSVEIAIRLYLK